MKKLHSFAVCALITPVLTLGAGSVLAQQSTDRDMDSDRDSTYRDKDAKKSSPGAPHSDKSTKRDWESDRQKMGGQANLQRRGFLDAAPANGMASSDLIGADVTTNDDDEVGSVSELIIDENGQVVAVVVEVGGFLGMGERDVAIGWDDITRSGTSDDLELRIDATRESLRSAPEFEKQD